MISFPWIHLWNISLFENYCVCEINKDTANMYNSKSHSHCLFILFRLKDILQVDLIGELFSTECVNPRHIIHNVTHINRNGVVTNLDRKGRSHYTLLFANQSQWGLWVFIWKVLTFAWTQNKPNIANLMNWWNDDRYSTTLRNIQMLMLSRRCTHFQNFKEW